MDPELLTLALDLDHGRPPPSSPSPRRSGYVVVAAAGLLVLLAALGTHQTMSSIDAHTHHVVLAQADAADVQTRLHTTLKSVTCERLASAPGKSLTTAIVEFPPGAFSPPHRHPGSVTALVLEGAVRSQVTGGPVGTYPTGATWFEPPGALHVLAENVSDTEPAEVLAIFVTDADCGPLVIPESK